MTLSGRVAEANRRRPIYQAAVADLGKYLGIVTTGYLRKPAVIDRQGHESVRFVDPVPEDAVLLKFARVVSLNRAALLLCDNGYIQEQAIIQRAIEETNEDIIFLSVNITGSGNSGKFSSILDEFWKEDYENPSKPVETKIKRAFSRRGISAFLHRVFGQPDPSLADGVSRAIFDMYSGFTHGAAPQIMELYDFDNHRFLTQGLSGTNRHLDYVLDLTNSLYRTLLSAATLAKAFGSPELLELAMKLIQKFESDVGAEKLMKEPV